MKSLIPWKIFNHGLHGSEILDIRAHPCHPWLNLPKFGSGSAALRLCVSALKSPFRRVFVARCFAMIGLAALLSTPVRADDEAAASVGTAEPTDGALIGT